MRLCAFLFTLALASCALAESAINVNFVHGNKTYRLPEDKAVLSTVYGPSWEESAAWRTYLKCQEPETRSHIQKLQAIRGNDVNINVTYDDPNVVHAGEQIFLSDKCGWETIQKGESLDAMLRRKFFNGRAYEDLTTREKAQLREAIDIVVANNPDRFNVHPHKKYGEDTINIPHDLSDFESYSSNEGLSALIVHEVAHTSDLTTPEGGYGGDGSHSFNEVTSQRMAFIEGWAIYNQALANPADRARIFDVHTNISREKANSTAKNPNYVHNFGGVSFEDRLATEGIVAATLLSIDDNGKHRDAIFASFKATNGASSDTLDVLQHYVKNATPEEANRAIMLFDVNTQFTASPAFLKEKFGEAATAYLQERQELEEKWVRCKFHGCSLERFIQGLNSPDEYPLTEWDKPIPKGEGYSAADGSYVISISSAGGDDEPLEDMELLDQADSEE